ncbi:MAG: WxL domain-containing protein [Lactiplantibacillus plantarum]
MQRPRRLITAWLGLLVLLMSLLVVNGGAIYATATTTATPIKFEEPPTELVIGQPFTLQLAVQGSQEHQVMVAIPEALTVDQTKTRQANRASLAELDFDADNRKLTLTPSDPTASTTFDLVLSASEAKTYKVTAEALITGPALATTTASAVASSEKPTTHTMTAEPITFTVAAGSAVDSPPEEAGTESAREVSNDAESTSSASQDPTTDDSSATATQAATTKRDDNNATSKSSEQSSSTTATSDPTADNDTATSRTAQADSEVERTPKATATKAANDITTAAIVVNPDGSTTVSTYDDLKSAYTNTAVTTIKLGASITHTSTSATELGTRTTSLTIDGQNHSLDLGIGNFTLGSTTTAQTMTVKNFSSIRGAIASGTSSGGAAGIIQSGTDGGANAGGARWTITVTDLITTSDVYRLVNAPGNQVNVSGAVTATTVAENMITGGMTFAASSTYIGRKANNSAANKAFFNFTATSTVGTGDRKVTIGSAANVNLLGSASDATRGIFYDQYDAVTVGTNAILTAKMYGNVYRAETANTFTANVGSKVTFENLATTSSNALYYTTPLIPLGNNSTFTVTGGELYITSSGSAPIFGGYMSGLSVLLDSPKAYDIKNTNFAILVQTGSIVETTIKSFKITNSNLSMWSLSLLNLLSASVTYQGITAIEQNGVLITNSGSVLPGLLTFSAARRIANTLSLPTVQFSSPYTSDLNAQLVTNADKKVRVRVITGYTESNGTQTPIYAGTGTATVKLTDDQGATQSGTTDSSGYVNFTLDHFPTAGATMTAQATTTYTSDPVTITVQDKTPPTPVTVKDGKIVADQKTIASGSTTTAGNTLRYTVNGTSAADSNGNAITATAASDGSWSLAMPATKLKANDVIQIFVKDSAGNENPVTSTTYHDATFAAATQYTVAPAIGPTAPTEPEHPGTTNTSGSENTGTGNTGELRLDYAPSQFNFGSVTTSMQPKTYAAQTINGVAKQWLQVSDNRLATHGWTVTARQNSPFTSTSGAQLTGAKLHIPAGQTYNERATGQLKSYAVDLTTAEQPVFAAPATANVGKDLSTNVWQPTQVQLTVPGNTAQAGQTYNTTVTWTLTANVTN